MQMDSVRSLALWETAASKNGGPAQPLPSDGAAFADVLQTASQPEESFADMWKAAYGKYFPQGAGQWFYHVTDASGIPDAEWQHNDFPFDRLMREEPSCVAILSHWPARSGRSPEIPDWAESTGMISHNSSSSNPSWPLRVSPTFFLDCSTHIRKQRRGYGFSNSSDPFFYMTPSE